MDVASQTSAAVQLAGLTMSFGLFMLLIFIVVGFIGLLAYWFRSLYWSPKAVEKRRLITVTRVDENPVLRPIAEHWWESEAVFNPAAFVDDGRVHLLYRAMGGDGISRIGYASSGDGIHFDDRVAHPVYDNSSDYVTTLRDKRYRKLSYDTDLYASGGGWGGCEDPRTVIINAKVYMTFGIFESWQSMRLAVTSLSTKDLRAGVWKWTPYIPMSPKQQTHKNWVLFPEKINGKFAILHSLTPLPTIEYIDELEELRESPIESNNNRGGTPGRWDAFVRGAAAPPIKTPAGWLLFYHGMNPEEPAVGYKVGAMLLDLNDPPRILYRTNQPVLEPTEWYENDWKPGVVYASGAVLFGDDIILYYGGGDKYIAAAKANYKEFLHTLMTGEHAELHNVTV